MTQVNNNTGVAPQYPTSAALPQMLPKSQADWQNFLNAMQARFPQLPLIPLTDTSGSANTITVTSTNPLTSVLAYGVVLRIKVANTNTSTTVNVNLNGLGNVLVVTQAGAGPSNGTLTAGGIYEMTFDGTHLQLT